MTTIYGELGWTFLQLTNIIQYSAWYYNHWDVNCIEKYKPLFTILSASERNLCFKISFPNLH